ncbi:hypothetical protein [Ilumatobacter coccineus]|nr:hypothetical protein [Ilumatobacter coccineus]
MAGALAGTMLFAACGGDDASTDEALPEASPDTQTDTGTEVPADVAATAVGAGFVDLVGAEVLPSAEIDTNQLPSVVVDDLTNDRKVNFRNLVPQDKPVLLWMWAPH